MHDSVIVLFRAAGSKRRLTLPIQKGGDWPVDVGRSRPLEILLIALGSAGDVHPFVGIGRLLRARGHHVTLATNPYFEPLVRACGLQFEPLGTAEELRSAMLDPDLWHPFRGFFLIVNRLMLPQMRAVYQLIAKHRAKNSRLVVAAPCTALGARLAQDRLGVPLATVHLQPSVLRSLHQSACLPGLMMGDRVPRWLKRAQYGLGDYVLSRHHIEPALNAFRAELRLPPVTKIVAEWWNSPQRVIGLFPDWFAPVQPDWPSQVVLTGFPLWDECEVTQAPQDLEPFLTTGSAPIVFTPGSAMLSGKAFFATAAAACRLLDRRAIFLTRHSEQLPRTLPAELRPFDFVPLSVLLPRAAAIVHHAGIGTAAQGLAAGIPQLAMPMTFDQPDNAQRLSRLGVATVISRRAFTVRAVADALDKLLANQQVAVNCRTLASRFDTPTALGTTCTAIESLESFN